MLECFSNDEKELSIDAALKASDHEGYRAALLALRVKGCGISSAHRFFMRTGMVEGIFSSVPVGPVAYAVFFDTLPDASSRRQALEDLTRVTCRYSHSARHVALLTDAARDIVFAQGEHNDDDGFYTWLAEMTNMAMSEKRLPVLEYVYGRPDGRRASDEAVASSLTSCATEMQGASFKDRRSGLPFLESYLDLETRTGRVMAPDVLHQTLHEIRNRPADVGPAIKLRAVHALHSFAQVHRLLPPLDTDAGRRGGKKRRLRSLDVC